MPRIHLKLTSGKTIAVEVPDDATVADLYLAAGRRMLGDRDFLGFLSPSDVIPYLTIIFHGKKLDPEDPRTDILDHIAMSPKVDLVCRKPPQMSLERTTWMGAVARAATAPHFDVQIRGRLAGTLSVPVDLDSFEPGEVIADPGDLKGFIRNLLRRERRLVGYLGVELRGRSIEEPGVLTEATTFAEVFQSGQLSVVVTVPPYSFRLIGVGDAQDLLFGLIPDGLLPPGSIVDGIVAVARMVVAHVAPPHAIIRQILFRDAPILDVDVGDDPERRVLETMTLDQVFRSGELVVVVD